MSFKGVDYYNIDELLSDEEKILRASVRRFLEKEVEPLVVDAFDKEEPIDMRELALAFPEYDNWIKQVRDRLVDLLIPFRKFHYYHPLQRGSASLKSVLPALTGKGYEGMDIADGQEASIAFQAVTYGLNIPEEKLELQMKIH